LLYNHHLCSQIDSRWSICYRDAKSIRLSYVEQPSGLAATILITPGRSLCFYIGQCHDATISQEKPQGGSEHKLLVLHCWFLGSLVEVSSTEETLLAVLCWLPCDCHLFYNDNILEKVSRIALGSFIIFWSFRWCLSQPWVFMLLGLLFHCFCKDWRVIGSINFVCIIWLHPSCFYQKHRIEQERKLGAIFDTAIANHQKYFVRWSAEQLSILTAFGEFLVGCIVD